MKTRDELQRILTAAMAMPIAQQKRVMSKLSVGDLEAADDIMSGLRSSYSHAERPSGGDTTCNTCGRLTIGNKEVLWAFHPAELGAYSDIRIGRAISLRG